MYCDFAYVFNIVSLSLIYFPEITFLLKIRFDFNVDSCIYVLLPLCIDLLSNAMFFV